MPPLKWHGLIVALIVLLLSQTTQAEMIYEELGPNYTGQRHYRGSQVKTDDTASSAITSLSSSRIKKPHKRVKTRTSSIMPAAYSERVIIVDPVAHRWQAYTAAGKLIRSGLATAGGKWCRDLGRPCRTGVGTFRIYSLGSWNCVSSKYPLGIGGARMPYCMFFNGSQGIHGSDAVVPGNVSHGCVRVSVSDAEWIRYNFARIGTKIIIRPY